MIFSVSHIHAVILITVLPVGFTRWSYGCAVHSSSVMSDSWLPYGLHAASQAAWFMGFSRQKYWSGLPAFLQGIFPTQESNPGLPNRRQIVYQLSHQGSLSVYTKEVNKTIPVGNWVFTPLRESFLTSPKPISSTFHRKSIPHLYVFWRITTNDVPS